MAGSKKRRRWLLAIVAVGLLCLAWRIWDVHRTQRAIAEAEAAMRAGRPGRAAQQLTALLATQPRSDQAAYLLGLCEQARGQPKAAFEAWGRIPLDSPFAGRVVLGRMDLLVQQGALGDAEQLIKHALEDRRHGRAGIAALLVLVYTQQGRFDDARRWIEDVWKGLNESGEEASEQAINLVRMHIELENNAPMTDAVRSYIDQSSERQPQDDRVWLGKANLALQARSFNEAARWLAACLGRRPDDPSVWRSKLSWAMATNRIADVRQALAHLRAQDSSPAEIHRLAAWIAARRGDLLSEKRELEQSIADDPEDFRTFDRLIELALHDRSPQRAVELRTQKAENERLRARYWLLYERNQPSRDSAEMGRLAIQLGRWFEAKVWLTVAITEEPNRADLRSELGQLNSRAQSIPGPGRTLEEMLAPALEADAPSVRHGNTGEFANHNQSP
jgi:enediyne biosynthesis protein E4